MSSSLNDHYLISKSSNICNELNTFKPIEITIASITGHQWSQVILTAESIDSLKEKIWNHTGLLPYYQGLVFGDASLSDVNGQTLLKDLGVRHQSLLRLVVITRSGPLSVGLRSNLAVPCSSVMASDKKRWNELYVFDVQKVTENKQTLLGVRELRHRIDCNIIPEKSLTSEAFSATEDTSAKESSAGDTECDDEKFKSRGEVERSAKILDLNLPYARFYGKRSRQASAKDEDSNLCEEVVVHPSARDRLLMMMQSRSVSHSPDVPNNSEDGSEFSSGMVICDLSNEFKRLRVRRKHHSIASNASASRVRGRSKTRHPLVFLAHQHKSSDVTSSDDERPHQRISEPTICTAFRRPSTISRTQKTLSGCQSQQRCYACAVRLSSFSVAFQCRCGKTLCARHRPAEMHTCARLRKLQDVSD